MRMFGLQFASEDDTVVQVVVDVKNLRVYARSCPKGQWTEWRRLDVSRNADGTLAETVEQAVNAKRADVAGRLSQANKIIFEGDAKGEVKFDGSTDVTCKLSIPTLQSLQNEIENLKKQIQNIKSSKGL